VRQGEGVFHALTISAAMFLHDGNHVVARALARPIPLQFKERLQSSGRDRSCLFNTAHGGVVRGQTGSAGGVLDRVNLVTAAMASRAGNTRQTSVHKAAATSFLRPMAATVLTNSGLSQEFMLVRSMGSWPGKISRSCGHMLPENLLVSTVVRMVGTLKMLAALASKRTLLPASGDQYWLRQRSSAADDL